MNDFEYDCLQKKRLARMAQYRKRGSRSKKCSLSTDHMTEKQWKERNGEVYTYNLSAPVSWADFKAFPHSIQKEYIERMVERYNANSTSLAQMFGVRPPTLRHLIEANGLGISFKVGNGMTTAQKERWLNFLACGGEIEPGPAPEPELPTEPPAPAVLAMPSGPTLMKQFSLVFEGKLDMPMIMNSILSIAGKNAEGRIEIICTL